MKNAFECYEMYLALKSHFSKASYDYFKYNGKMNVSVSSFEIRKDKFHFVKLAKHRDPEGVLLSNFVFLGTDLWIGDISMDTYKAWLKVKESLHYTFSKELELLDEDLESNFKVVSGQLPNVIKLVMRKQISIETFTIIADLMGLLRYYDKELANDPAWDKFGMLSRKYTPFINYDKVKFKDTMRNRFLQPA